MNFRRSNRVGRRRSLHASSRNTEAAELVHDADSRPAHVSPHSIRTDMLPRNSLIGSVSRCPQSLHANRVEAAHETDTSLPRGVPYRREGTTKRHLGADAWR